MDPLIKKYAPELAPILLLEDIISHRIRRRIIKLLFVVFLIALGIFLFTEDTLSRGIFISIFALIMIFEALEAYFYSSYASSFRGSNSMVFSFAEIIFNARGGDIIRSFFFSDLGYEVMMRLDISEDAIIEYLKLRPKDGTELINSELTNENFADELLKPRNLMAVIIFFVERGKSLFIIQS